jgi:hypothetical protein
MNSNIRPAHGLSEIVQKTFLPFVSSIPFKLLSPFLLTSHIAYLHHLFVHPLIIHLPLHSSISFTLEQFPHHNISIPLSLPIFISFSPFLDIPSQLFYFSVIPLLISLHWYTGISSHIMETGYYLYIQYNKSDVCI